jgi:outer membrane protein
MKIESLAALSVIGLLLPMPALAELSNDGLLGAGVRSRPAYDGSASQRTELVPVIRYFGPSLFARSTQGVLEGGARFEIAPGLNIGAQLAYEPGRNGRDSDFLKLRRVPDVDRGASIGVHVEWDHKFGPVPIALLARARQHTESDRGAQLDFRLSAGVFQSGRFGAGLFTQATWANAKSANSFYGVTAPVAAAGGLPAFSAGSGWLYTSFGLLWSVDLTKQWIAVGNMEARHLRGDAASSPLAERASNYYLTAGVAYRF